MSDDRQRPRIAGVRPLPARVLKGLTYFWCSCGLSRNQPFCDNSHAGTGFEPIPFTAHKDEIVFFCACKHSSEGPVCDGKTHQKMTPPPAGDCAQADRLA